MTTSHSDPQIMNPGRGLGAGPRRPRLREQTRTSPQTGRRRPLPDAWQIVEFAETWSPFGGPPDEELFVRFGMNRARFAEVLAESVAQIGYQLRRRRPPGEATRRSEQAAARPVIRS